jgi:hypothetical protein
MIDLVVNGYDCRLLRIASSGSLVFVAPPEIVRRKSHLAVAAVVYQPGTQAIPCVFQIGRADVPPVSVERMRRLFCSFRVDGSACRRTETMGHRLPHTDSDVPCSGREHGFPPQAFTLKVLHDSANLRARRHLDVSMLNESHDGTQGFHHVVHRTSPGTFRRATTLVNLPADQSNYRYDDSGSGNPELSIHEETVMYRGLRAVDPPGNPCDSSVPDYLSRWLSAGVRTSALSRLDGHLVPDRRNQPREYPLAFCPGSALTASLGAGYPG